MVSQGQVVGGHYIGAMVHTNLRGEVAMQSGFKKLPKLSSDQVLTWDEVVTGSRGGAAGALGAVGQAVAGAVLPGFMGKAASAALGAGIDVAMRPPHLVRVDWVDGKQSLIKLPDQLFRHFTMMLEDQRVPAVEPDTDDGRDSAPYFDVAEHLKKLAGLRDQGILTEAEFSAKKTDLLARL